MGFFAKGLRVKGAAGENEISAPSLPGLTKRSVIRGGFMFVEALTFMILTRGILSSTPWPLTISESPQS